MISDNPLPERPSIYQSCFKLETKLSNVSFAAALLYTASLCGTDARRAEEDDAL